MGDILTIIALVNWESIEEVELEYFLEGVSTLEEYMEFRDDRDFVTKFMRLGDFWATREDFRRLAHIVATRVLE